MIGRYLVLLLAAWCWYSCAARCPAPRGWYVNGARPDGTFELRPVLGRPEDDIEDAHRSIDIVGPAPVAGRLRCRQGSARQDSVSVWCAR